MLETSFVAAEEIISFAVVEEPMLKGLKNVLVTLVGGVVEAADVVSVIVDVEAIDVVVASDEVNIVRVSDVNSGDVDVDLLANILDTSLGSTDEISSFTSAKVPMLKGSKNVLVTLVWGLVVACVVFRRSFVMLFSTLTDGPNPLLPDVISITSITFLISSIIVVDLVERTVDDTNDISKSILGGKSEGAGKSEKRLLIKIEGGISVVLRPVDSSTLLAVDIISVETPLFPSSVKIIESFTVLDTLVTLGTRVLPFIIAVVPMGTTVSIVGLVISGIMLPSLPVTRGPVVGLAEVESAFPIEVTASIVLGVTSDMILLSFPVAPVPIVEVIGGATGGK